MIFDEIICSAILWLLIWRSFQFSIELLNANFMLQGVELIKGVKRILLIKNQGKVRRLGLIYHILGIYLSVIAIIVWEIMILVDIFRQLSGLEFIWFSSRILVFIGFSLMLYVILMMILFGVLSGIIKWNEFTVELNGATHVISFSINCCSRKFKIGVDGQITKTGNCRMAIIPLLDQPINIGGKIYTLMVFGNNSDIVVDGICINSKRPYVPVKRIPWWSWMFVAICWLCSVFLRGVISIIAALLGSVVCLIISVSPYGKNTHIKLCVCVITSILVWILSALFNM